MYPLYATLLFIISINCESTAKELHAHTQTHAHTHDRLAWLRVFVLRFLDYAPFACPIRISRLSAPVQNKMRSNWEKHKLDKRIATAAKTTTTATTENNVGRKLAKKIWIKYVQKIHEKLDEAMAKKQQRQRQLTLALNSQRSLTLPLSRSRSLAVCFSTVLREQLFELRTCLGVCAFVACAIACLCTCACGCVCVRELWSHTVYDFVCVCVCMSEA